MPLECPKDMLQVLALVGMASDSDIRSEADPVDYYGMEEWVSAMKSDPIDTLKLLVFKTCGLEWNGTERLYPFLNNELKRLCMYELHADSMEKTAS